MAIYKNDNGTWYVMIRYQDWTGARKQKCKRGFSTRKEAADWELQFKLQKKASVDMTMVSNSNGFPFSLHQLCAGPKIEVLLRTAHTP